jgi:arylsulfatase A-like enzyme
VDQAVSLLDVAPTLLDLAGETFPANAAEGISLIGPLLGTAEQTAERTLFSEVSFALGDWSLKRDRQKVSFKTALIEGPLKLVHDLETDRWSLYDRHTDPAERRDVYDDRPETAELRARLMRWEESRPRERNVEPAVEIDPKERERLRSLGYVR